MGLQTHVNALIYRNAESLLYFIFKSVVLESIHIGINTLKKYQLLIFTIAQKIKLLRQIKKKPYTGLVC